MIKRMAKDIMDDDIFPSGLPYGYRAILWGFTNENDKWEYIKTKHNKLDNLFLRSSSGLIFSTISGKIIGVEKGSQMKEFQIFDIETFQQ